MRLRISRASAEERIARLATTGLNLATSVLEDYQRRRGSHTFDPAADPTTYQNQVSSWIADVVNELDEIFPSEWESQAFLHAQPAMVSYADGENMRVYGILGSLRHRAEWLRNLWENGLDRYVDLPLATRVFVEDIDSFAKVRDINPALASPFLLNGRVTVSEDDVQRGLESILEVPTHKLDWGGEENDLYTGNLRFAGRRRATAFLLKGPLQSREMRIRDLGANGDQLVRLFQSPAELFVIQHVGPIHESVIKDAEAKAQLLRSRGTQACYCVIDGQDTTRLLLAYGHLQPQNATA